MTQKEIHADLKLLGAADVPSPSLDHPTPELLERFPNPQSIKELNPANTDLSISLTIPDFTSLCPITGQPDYANLTIDYTPDRWCVETKSLKMYLQSFRMFGIFNEACISIISSALVELLKPCKIHVEGIFAARGGIVVKPVSSWEKQKS
jgi:7-cyano-7-deazaguanine reductase